MKISSGSHKSNAGRSHLHFCKKVHYLFNIIVLLCRLYWHYLKRSIVSDVKRGSQYANDSTWGNYMRYVLHMMQTAVKD